MTSVNISGTMRKDERPFNGLEAITDELIDESKQLATYLVVAEIRPQGYHFSSEDGTKVPTVKFMHVEVITDDADMKAVKSMLTSIYAQRTGQEVPATLPYDAEGWAADEKPATKGTRKADN